ncbi:copper chaperone PCu(A)C [Deinococcus sp. YIM 77859]|uniref:copper chaperone PCu(A)C n=1 Tax=Deinococcus sp. YIM 77859 TaxID=1540221 RepID=UPI0005511D4F|nr:copper chaperone PCu(A)C [Deinococcus sp. YIM 77859]
MSTPTPLFAALALAAVLLPAAALNAARSQPAQSRPAPLPLTVQGATVVAVPPVASETSALMTLRNSGKAPVVLTGASAAVAGHVMLMTTRKDAQGRLGMQAVRTLTVPAGGTLNLTQGGDHLMLMDLKRPLKVGETLRLKLTAKDGRTLNVNAVVRLPGLNHEH